VTSNDQQRGRIESEATDWLVLQTAGGLDSLAESAFETWIGRNPLHRAVYDELRGTWDSLAELQGNPGDLLRHTAPLHHRAQTLRPPRRLAAALTALAATLLLVAALVASIWSGDLATLLTADHRSTRGEIRAVVLADGSHVNLGPASAIRLQFSADERRVELLSGSAFFHPVSQALANGRPFIVETGNLSVRALGTQFVVERLADRDYVAVAEHDVEVTLRGVDEQRLVLSPGQTMQYRHGAPQGIVGSIDPREIAAWRSGNLVFYQAPLGEVVAELNRYRRSRIVIMDDELSARVVSGVVRADDPAGALRVVTDELRVRKTELPLFVIIHK
jgi:transmembrane sensor